MKNAKEKNEEKQKKASFISDTNFELKRVNWPNNETITKATILILFIVTFTILYFGVLDVAFSKGFLYLKA